ncbi:MAG: preprotein translocase subunit SecG [Candidatus Omnitrophica bacterium]|nr:preprotein translocase subunit SecG [Candidatus Omnitrophota bacterium]
MITLLIVLHVVACALLITLVLIQRGRGGGLVESFAGVESMFGTKTNAFLTRATTVLSVVFFFTCLSLAILSVKQSRSLLSNVRPAPVAQNQSPLTTGQAPAAAPAATTTATAQTPAKPQETPKADQK